MNNYLETSFDRDVYFGTHPRNLFSASQWLTTLLDENYDWPKAAYEISTFLRERNASAHHISEQVEKAKLLIAPWLLQGHRNAKVFDK